MSKTIDHVVYNRFSPPPSPAVHFKDASLTRQEFAEEADINNIMRKYASGLPPSSSGSRPPLFGDFSNVPSYQDALDKVIEAQTLFSELPSQVRKRFDNDPARLLEFIADESNRDEAVKLGLVNKPVEPVNKPVDPAVPPAAVIADNPVPDDKSGAA